MVRIEAGSDDLKSGSSIMEKKRPIHHYRLERNHDGTVTMHRVTLSPRGWMENGSYDFPDEDSARAPLLKSSLVRSWPPSYGNTNVIEYWDEPPKKDGEPPEGGAY